MRNHGTTDGPAYNAAVRETEDDTQTASPTLRTSAAAAAATRDQRARKRQNLKGLL